jgi:hypothetical protein
MPHRNMTVSRRATEHVEGLCPEWFGWGTFFKA